MGLKYMLHLHYFLVRGLRPYPSLRVFHEEDLGNFREVDRSVLISTCLLSTAAFHRVESEVDWTDRSEYARGVCKVTRCAPN